MWLAIAATLVAGMQVGFLFLEAGFVRSKNSINVALKNIADFALAVIAFCFVGAAIMFASDTNGIVGFDWSLAGYDDDGSVVLFLLLQAFFCGTAATIVSGAIAERMHFSAYVILTLPLTALLYPIIGHWAWASSLPGGAGQGWLEARGFIDFAGSSVVHATGGAAALAILLIIGPRTHRFSDEEENSAVHGHSPVLAGGGALMLLVGWLGFNSGGLVPGSDEFSRALANTIFAGTAGCLAACVVGRQVEGYYRSDRMINGMLIGLVAITASAPFAKAGGALLLGFAAGGLSIFFANWMEQRLKIDDAVYAVTVHGFGGILGTLAVPFVLRPEVLTRTPVSQFGVQLLGVTAITLSVFAIMFALAAVMNSRGKLRISSEMEARGLNIVEHGALMGSAALVETLQKISQGEADISKRVDFDPFEDGSEVAEAVNVFLDRVETAERKAREQIERNQQQLSQMAVRERKRADETGEILREFQSDFAALVGELKAQAGELAEGSTNLASRTDESGELVTHVHEQANEAVSMSEQMSEGASLLAQTLDLVSEKIAQANEATSHAENASRQGADIAATLEDSTRAIGRLVALIKAISDKTSVLALNARIEAARAGEAGLGFSVVSEEVGALARQADEASGEIGGIIGSLVELIGSSIAQFRAIDGNMANVRALSESVEQSALAQRETSQTLSTLIDGARQQALGNGAAVAQVSANFNETGATIGMIDNSSKRLESLAQRIDREVARLHDRIVESDKVEAAST
ncbi:methyl-accepting chemotaxis protein [Erythrobacter sp. W53]|uniref:methyl-accepting chemotaxis protein n=1 Tax=Erythrobacter sp. W53 TaxID=3425947 RepID=UPI003D766D3D